MKINALGKCHFLSWGKVLKCFQYVFCKNQVTLIEFSFLEINFSPRETEIAVIFIPSMHIATCICITYTFLVHLVPLRLYYKIAPEGMIRREFSLIR